MTAQHTNWAGNITFSTETLDAPPSIEQLQSTVATSPRIRALGTGHSFNRIADTTGRLVSVAALPLRFDIDSERSTAETDAAFRGTSAILVHDVAMYVAVPIVLGHLYLALVHPSTRHSLRGMALGTVRRERARRHHPKWEREL